MKNTNNNIKNQTDEDILADKERLLFLTKTFFSGDSIYEAYNDKFGELKDFREDVASFIKFLQELCRAGIKENDISRYQGIINFSTSFLIKNFLDDEITTGGNK